MRSIFEELFQGDVYPSETIQLKGVEFEDARTRYTQTYTKFYQSLNEEQCTAIEELLDQYAVLDDLYCRAYYEEGFKTGIRIMAETYVHNPTCQSEV